MDSSATSSVEPSSSLRSIGRYEIVRRIAAGGMATVYRARARGVDGFRRAVAIKLCHPHLREDPAFVAMFLDEARIASSIHHANVVATIDLGREDALYIVMEYVDGGRLSDLLRPRGAPMQRIAVPVAMRIILDALAGLDAAHEARDERGERLHVVHRDISPQNILVGRDGVARVADFGIAKAAARASVTATGQIKGKLAYMAPEQLRGAPADRRLDVFAAGVVLWEMLTGRRLFAADSESEVSGQVLHREIEPPSRYSPEIPPALDAAVLHALQRDPDARTPSARAMAEEIEAAGVTIASPRAVAALVDERLDAQAEDSAPELVVSAQQTVIPEQNARRTASESAPTAVERPRPSRSSRGQAAILVIALVVSLALASLLWLRSRGARASTEAPAPSTTASAAEAPRDGRVAQGTVDASGSQDAGEASAADAGANSVDASAVHGRRPPRANRPRRGRTPAVTDEFIPSRT